MASVEPDYRIEFEAKQKLVRMSLTGLWTRQILESYQRDGKLGLSEQGIGSAGVLIDMRHFAVQTQEVVDTLLLLIASRGQSSNPHAFILSSSAIQKIQLGRMVTQLKNAAFFKEEGEALAWLADQRGVP